MAAATGSAATPPSPPSRTGIDRKPHQPHYQSRDYNALNGGIARWFEPVPDATARPPALQAILRVCHALFERADRRCRAWHVEVHQFRIEARPGEAGQPTPEGMHRTASTGCWC